MFPYDFGRFGTRRDVGVNVIVMIRDGKKCIVVVRLIVLIN